MTGRLARVPVRLRVTLAFTAAMAVLLAATGAFLYLRLGSTLTGTVDRGLRGRAADLAAVVEQRRGALSDTDPSALTARSERLAQLLDAHGRVVDATPGLRGAQLLSPAQRAAAARRPLIVTVPSPEEHGERLRVLAAPVGGDDGDGKLVLVATSLEPTREAQQTLGGQLLLGGPVLLLVAALIGYAAAAIALRPVESMRRKAAAIHAGRLGERLPVPAADDEVARLGATLNAMLARLEDAFTRERTFVADASHELRTPLAILKAELELARRDATTTVEFRAAVASAAEETDRLVQLAEDLLVIARADQGRLPVERGPVHVAALLGSTADRFAVRAVARGVALVVDAPRDLVVAADALRLEQALGNLVDNALRHGAGAVRLTGRAVPDGGVRLVVTDDGPGFPPAFLPRAFDRFSRADGARGRGGSGLGLAIARTIAEAHGGTATAANRPDGPGAEVTIDLP